LGPCDEAIQLGRHGHEKMAEKEALVDFWYPMGSHDWCKICAFLSSSSAGFGG